MLHVLLCVVERHRRRRPADAHDACVAAAEKFVDAERAA